MSKVTVITDANGKIAAIGQGHLGLVNRSTDRSSRLTCGLFALPGQRIHEIDLTEDVSDEKGFTRLHERVVAHLARRLT